jgi:hypothetical protein
MVRKHFLGIILYLLVIQQISAAYASCTIQNSFLTDISPINMHILKPHVLLTGLCELEHLLFCEFTSQHWQMEYKNNLSLFLFYKQNKLIDLYRQTFSLLLDRAYLIHALLLLFKFFEPWVVFLKGLLKSVLCWCLATYFTLWSCGLVIFVKGGFSSFILAILFSVSLLYM